MFSLSRRPTIPKSVKRVGKRRSNHQLPNIARFSAIRCAPLLQDVVREGIVAALPDGSDLPATIFSRAGHDGMAMGAVTDVGMLFLRNPDGISHHPDEAVSGDDVERGIRALAEAVAHLAAEPRP